MTSPVITIEKTQSTNDAIRLMAGKHISGVLVVDSKGQPNGFLSQNDILRALSGNQDESTTLNAFLNTDVGSLMTPSVISCTINTPLAEVRREMRARRIHRLVVMDEAGQVAGLVSTSDLIAIN